MPFRPFHDFFPKLAEDETRSVTFGPSPDNPLGGEKLSFVEMYCDEPGCDCRRVLFTVMSRRRQRLEAVVGWGWEDVAFYAKWLKHSGPELAGLMKGPALNPGSPATRLAPYIVELTQEVLLQDPAYVERIKQHYAMFRARVDEEERKRTAKKQEEQSQKPKEDLSWL